MKLVAVNHWSVAVQTHQLNHPTAHHYLHDLERADPETIVPEGYLDILLASPECRFYSRARGDCVLFQDAGDPTVASVDPRTGAVTGHRPGYGTVTVESCGYGPPVTVHINVYSKVRTEPSAGPTLNEIRIETKDRQVLLRPGDSEPISIWAAYDNGQSSPGLQSSSGLQSTPRLRQTNNAATLSPV